MSKKPSKQARQGTASPAARGRRVYVTAAIGFLACAFLAGVVWALARDTQTPVYSYEVVNVYPHHRDAFTQGLVYDNGVFYEGTGLEGKSQLRRVDVATGKVQRAVRLAPKLFGEGVAVLGDNIYQLTWKSGTGFVYDKKTMRRKGTFRYAGEGWGLTTDGTYLIMSDGTPIIRYLNPATFKEVGRMRVTDEGRTIDNLNELEYIGGEIFANIWKENRIARIARDTGRVTGWIDLSGLLPLRDRRPLKDMHLNGIAFDATGNRLFVTGKNWPKMFEIKLRKKR